MSLKNKLLGEPGTCANTGGSLVSLGHNLAADPNCVGTLDAPGDVTGVDPLLGPLLLDAPGTTPTHPLLPGSPATGAANNAACPATNQRGVARPQGPTCDIGAYEFVRLSQSITFAPLADRYLAQSPFVIAASAASALPVAFAGETPAVCTVSGDVATLLAEGMCTLTATQAGDPSYEPAPSVQCSFKVNSGSFTYLPISLE